MSECALGVYEVQQSALKTRNKMDLGVSSSAAAATLVLLLLAAAVPSPCEGQYFNPEYVRPAPRGGGDGELRLAAYSGNYPSVQVRIVLTAGKLF